MNSRVSDRLLIALFCTALALPTAARLGGWSDAFQVEVEKRLPAPWPTVETRTAGPISWPRTGSLEAFPAKFEAWLNDRLGLRRAMLQSFAWARLQGFIPSAATAFSDGGLGGSPVLIGRDGWLFYAGQGSIESFRRTRPFTAAELDRWRTVLRERREWLARRGIAYLVVIAPDKHTIYPEQMPASLTPVGPKSRLDQLVAALNSPDDAPLLDLRPTLLAGKAVRPVYYKTDSHWNAYGAHLAESAMVERLRDSVPTLRIPSIQDFDLIESPTSQGGDLAVMLDAPIPPDDWRIELRPRRTRVAATDSESIDLGGGLYVRGNISTCTSAAGGTAIVLHDSFFEEPRASFSEHWRRAVYVHTYDFPTDLIDRERPQVVIQEIVERGLMNLHPANPPLRDSRSSSTHWARRDGDPVR